MIPTKRLNRGGHKLLEDIQAPLTRIELHIHLDGSIRHETAYELAKAKGVQLPGKGSFEELVDYFVVKKPVSLGDFLERFHVILPCLKGDVHAIERVAYEFVEDCASHGVIYAEARFCPQILIPEAVISQERGEERKKWVWDVTGALMKGIQRGQDHFQSKVNLIATTIRGYPQSWYDDTMELLLDSSFHQGRLVGLDMAARHDTSCESHMLDTSAIRLFDDALKHGIHRTVHAGESGGPKQVEAAMDLLHAERIGHGYRLIDDMDGMYERVRKEQVHLECCPWSSILTASVALGHHPHPVVQFFRDEFNVSVSTDDPTITGTRMDDEYELLSSWGLREPHFVRGNFNAARSCFLPEAEKKQLIETLGRNYGAIL